ncbi:hypothetical protein IEO21_01141 [Rhodonia placenta]|uniref:Uncharacterized protein n=2 Tax=Rhodonia placenta TaxID=104341 RepID=A0A1X6MNG8_9APHY|nr:hypothetical protein POSPLADRAFT_1067793 [Postia placenta MAD-698-R-SB12]KAF9820914.1 hypothetical protein IEO21_01141 [Postia placenta]OSX57776.1 hypothetical protein POSPLADRAFT_1067793 [Postia placenta MAD-698-R-SB12]
MQLIAARTAGVRSAIRAARLVPALRTYATPATFKDDDDPQLADYPRLPYISKQRRPARGWEDWQMRRNFGEPLHEQEEILSMWGPDAPVVPPSTALRWFMTAVAGFTTFGVITKFALIPSRPSVPREYPYSGLETELGGLEENKARPESETDEE